MDDFRIAKETVFFNSEPQIYMVREKIAECGKKVFNGFYSGYMILRIHAVILPRQDKNVDYLPGILQFLARKGCWCWNFVLLFCAHFSH